MILLTGIMLTCFVISLLNLDFPADYNYKSKTYFRRRTYILFPIEVFGFEVRHIYDIYFNPAIVFVGSFMILALTGGFLLMLPSATTNGITFTNALFTSTSAVCVTGLAVVDTSTAFTVVGQSLF